MTPDAGVLAGALLLGAGGIFAVYRALRVPFDGPVSLLAALLLAGASPLTTAIARADLASVAAFAVTATLLWAAAVVPRQAMAFTLHVAAGLLPAALVPLHTPAGHGVLDALFGPGHGLFSMTPVVYAAFVGTLATSHRQPAHAAVRAGSVVLWAAVGAPVVAAAAMLAPGLAETLQWMRRRPLVAMAPLVALALAWNYWLMVQYTVGALPKDEPVSFAAMVRQQADVHTQPPYAYPFAFPANAYLAWRHDVPVSRYDVLFPVRPEASYGLTFDRAADRFLLEGWGAPGNEPAGPARWMNDRRATVVLPLARPTSDLAIHVTARARLDEPAMKVALGLEVNGTPVGAFEVLPTAPAEHRVVVPAAVVGRVVRAGYNRFSIVIQGIHRLDPTDSRPAGPLAKAQREGTWPVALYRIQVQPAS